MRDKTKTLWTGFRLRCPNCTSGRIFSGLRMNKMCQNCGVYFERPAEGDFLVTIVMVYATTAVLIAGLVFLINMYLPHVSVAAQMIFCLVFGLALSLASHRHWKGFSIALIHLTFGLQCPDNS